MVSVDVKHHVYLLTYFEKGNCAGVFVHVLRGRTMMYFFFFFGTLCCIVTSRVFLCGKDCT